eukprot:5983647-Lingulodinium_polyedra.AAC.1
MHDMRSDVFGVMVRALSTNQHVAAEAFFSSKDLKDNDVFDFEAVCADYAAWQRSGEEAHVAETPAVLPPPSPPLPAPENAKGDEPPLLEEDTPIVHTVPDPEKERPNVDVHFPDLQFAPSVLDFFNAVEPSRLEK